MDGIHNGGPVMKLKYIQVYYNKCAYIGQLKYKYKLIFKYLKYNMNQPNILGKFAEILYVSLFFSLQLDGIIMGVRYWYWNIYKQITKYFFLSGPAFNHPPSP